TGIKKPKKYWIKKEMKLLAKTYGKSIQMLQTVSFTGNTIRPCKQEKRFILKNKIQVLANGLKCRPTLPPITYRFISGTLHYEKKLISDSCKPTSVLK